MPAVVVEIGPTTVVVERAGVVAAAVAEAISTWAAEPQEPQEP
jgi:hypothetical protein